MVHHDRLFFKFALKIVFFDRLKSLLFRLSFFYLFLPFCYPDDLGRLSTSTLHLPVIYSQEELERSLNRYYLEEENGIFCQDDSFSNFNHDRLKSICRQQKKIKIDIRKNRVLTQVPIQIDATYLIDKSFTINLFFYRKTFKIQWEKDISFNIFVTFKTTIKLDDQLNLIPETTWSFRWLSYPSVHFGIFSFRVDQIAEKAIVRTLEEYAQNRINQTLIEEIDLKKIIQSARDITSAPLLLDPKRNIWSLVKMEEVKVGEIDLKSGEIRFYFQSDFHASLGFSFETTSWPNFESIEAMYDEPVVSGPLISSEDKTNVFSAYFTFNMSADKLEELIFKTLAKQSIKVGTENQQFEISEIYINKIDDFIESDIYLKNLDANDRIKRYLMHFRFKPYYDQVARKIKMRDLSYEVKTDSHLVNLGSVVFRSEFKKDLESNIAISLEDYLDLLKEDLNLELNNFKIDPQKWLYVHLNSLELEDILIKDSSLLIFLATEGNAQLTLKRLF